MTPSNENVTEPFCVTVMVCPATLSVPVRGDVEVFGSIETVTVPFPVPPAPPVTLIQVTLLVAVQAQVPVVVTVALAVPPLNTIVCDVGDTTKLHGAGALGSVGDLLLRLPHPAAVRRSITTAKPFITRSSMRQVLRARRC